MMTEWLTTAKPDPGIRDHRRTPGPVRSTAHARQPDTGPEGDTTWTAVALTLKETSASTSRRPQTRLQTIRHGHPRTIRWTSPAEPGHCPGPTACPTSTLSHDGRKPELNRKPKLNRKAELNRKPEPNRKAESEPEAPAPKARKSRRKKAPEQPAAGPDTGGSGGAEVGRPSNWPCSEPGPASQSTAAEAAEYRMTDARPQQRILQIREEIRWHDHSYYVDERGRDHRQRVRLAHAGN